MNNEFETEQYLVEKRRQHYAILDADFPIIDRLCKKVDVVKKVYQLYSSDLSCKRSDEEIHHNRYVDLFELLLSAAKLLKDYKFLNTALKLNDLLSERGVVDGKKQEKNFEQLSILLTVELKSALGVENERT